MSLTKKHGIYYVVFRDLRGKVNSRSLHTRDEAEAKEEEKKFLFMLRESRKQYANIRNFPLLNALQTSQNSQFSQPSHRLKLDKMLAIAEKKRNLSSKHKSAFNHLRERLKSKCIYADDITPQIALNYLETFYTKGNGKTYNNIKSALNTIFRCCLIEANLTQSPFQNIINKRVTDIDSHRNLSNDEINKVMEILPLPMQVMTMLSRWTAQRLETCARMTPEMFDFERKVFIIKPSKTARFNKYVCCPIMPELEKFIKPILKKCKNPDLPIVKQLTDTQFSNHLISKNFKIALTKCGITDTDEGKASFHSLRGSAITYFKELGVPSDDLRLMTGHDTDNVEAIYDRSAAQISKIALKAGSGDKSGQGIP